MRVNYTIKIGHFEYLSLIKTNSFFNKNRLMTHPNNLNTDKNGKKTNYKSLFLEGPNIFINKDWEEYNKILFRSKSLDQIHKMII